ncbi:unnamed protein product [Schistosoma curassoni]|uniref:MYND-type domain-containing protein n=1 Tax=Schistosoma curassoni TaxID=6186 RepID=A0A183K5W9_9TREM|nr:unnamed protein product [Schistosoma curassoni]
MPKKKTGQRKKAEKAKIRQKLLRTKGLEIDLINHPSNILMSIQRLPVCCHCGKQKCSARSGDCLVKHGSTHVTGLSMVGAVCDFCEAWICHGEKCLSVHACECPLRDAVVLNVSAGYTVLVVGCFLAPIVTTSFVRTTSLSTRYVVVLWNPYNSSQDNIGSGCLYCQRLESENFKCASCNKMGTQTCLRCKVTYCDDHCKRKGVKYERGRPIPCPKCGHDLTDSYNLSVSVRSYEYGRQTCVENYSDEDNESENEEEQCSGKSEDEHDDDDYNLLDKLTIKN